MDVEECLKEWEDLLADYKRLEVNSFIDFVSYIIHVGTYFALPFE